MNTHHRILVKKLRPHSQALVLPLAAGPASRDTTWHGTTCSNACGTPLLSHVSHCQVFRVSHHGLLLHSVLARNQRLGAANNKYVREMVPPVPAMPVSIGVQPMRSVEASIV